MKKILINFLYPGEKESGIFRYSYELFRHLENKEEVQFLLVTNKEISINNLEVIKINLDSKRKAIFFIKVQLILNQLIKKIKPDILMNLYHLGYFFNFPQIMVIHDLIPLTITSLSYYKERLLTYLYFKFFLKKLIKKSSMIVTVSQSSKKDIIDIFKIDEDKVKVIYPGIDKEKFKKLNISKEDFYLVVNATSVYKNVDYLIKFWKKFKIDKKLVIVGHQKYFSRYFYYLKDLVKKFNLGEKIIFYNSLSDEKLIQLYNQAKALISPSLKEGFNLTALEAVACGTPLVLSAIDVHQEVYGSIGIFFNFDQEESLLEALEKLEKLDQREFEEKRKIFLENFDWQKTAEKIFDLLKNVS